MAQYAKEFYVKNICEYITSISLSNVTYCVRKDNELPMYLCVMIL